MRQRLVVPGQGLVGDAQDAGELAGFRVDRILNELNGDLQRQTDLILGRPGARIAIKGWRGRLFGLGRAPDATGEGRLSANGAVGAIRVAAAEPEGGAFVFHLSADPAR